jgi:hypothetical protein
LLIWKQVIMSKNSFSAAGGDSAASLHRHKSTELCCSVTLGPGETISSESALESPLLAKALNAIASVVTIREQYAEVVLIFKNSEDAAKAKNPLKTCEIVVKGANKRDYKRKFTVEVLQPKKSEVVVQPVLPRFDISRLPYVSPYTLDEGPPILSWLDNKVLFCGIFNVSGGGIFLVEPVSDSRRAMCYTKELATTHYRIAHPDYPKTIAKCHEMCKKLNGTYEYGWTFLCQLNIPVPILEKSDYWDRLRPF